MTITGYQLIGNTVSRLGTQSFTGQNRLTNTPLDPVFYEATPAEIDRAVHLADEAFWTYRKKSGAERAAFLDAIAEEMLALGDELIQTTQRETALAEGRLLGERGRTIGQLRLFADFIRDNAWLRPIIAPAQPDRTPLPRPNLRQQQLALGPVAIFGASNFPFAFSVAGGDTVSALAAGCPVVFKAHPAHPITCELVGTAILKAAQRTHMPEGVFSMVHGVSHRVGETLVAHPLLKAVGFTGSFRGGKALYDLAVRRNEPIPVYAEMGSTNPVFFLPGALAGDTAGL
ncbi:MAG: aldehyde dehydrogenase family protein, partial [Bacteroidetes bacterium]|nr:aldehyde dehydrogenase family protein [Fibrella sp.]